MGSVQIMLFVITLIGSKLVNRVCLGFSFAKFVIQQKYPTTSTPAEILVIFNLSFSFIQQKAFFLYHLTGTNENVHGYTDLNSFYSSIGDFPHSGFLALFVNLMSVNLL